MRSATSFGCSRNGSTRAAIGNASSDYPITRLALVYGYVKLGCAWVASSLIPVGAANDSYRERWLAGRDGLDEGEAVACPPPEEPADRQRRGVDGSGP